MNKRMQEALRETVQSIVDAGIKHQFTLKDLRRLGVIQPCPELSATRIKTIRRQARLSQAVFAQLLNVSTSTLQQWEQGRKRPSGTSQVLLELLRRTPNALDFRLSVTASQ